ncbi:MAG: magnesium chelatase [Bacteroidetes bacterium MedPE-SWsnd-G2]|nr:MAG: magnesium chelatase [Bacteroidetes bacterium MedPE-SWsnd-G2]
MIETIENIDWEVFHFLRPELLWLIAPLVVILIVGLLSIKDDAKWKSAIAPHLRPYMIQKGSESFRRWSQVFLFVILSIGVLGLAGPTWKKIEMPDKILETPLVIALDLSQSMLTKDIQPNRLERAKFKINDFLDANPRSRIGFIAYAGTAHTIIPLTRDYNIIKSHISGIGPHIMPFRGSDLESALVLNDSMTKSIEAPGTLLLITDDFSERNFQLMRNFVLNGNTKLEIMAMNTPGGGKVPNFNGRGNLKDTDAETRLNIDVINKLRAIENINVNDLTLDNSDMVLLANKISADLEFREKQELNKEDWQDEGLLLVVPLAIGMLLWFRKGWVVYFFVMGFMITSCSQVNEGTFDEAKEMTADDWWYTKSYQGQKKYDNGDYAEAAKLYEDPMHKGVAYYKSGNYTQAINEFSKDTTAQGAYNLGLAYYENGDYLSAERAFEKAEELDSNFEAATNNKNRVSQILQETSEANLDDATEVMPEERAQNMENDSSEDFSGGGQEATEEDMKKERLEEETETDIRKAEELEELPEDFEGGPNDPSQKFLMRKIDDDPALFIKRKFRHQVKKNKMNPKSNLKKW